MRRALPYLVFGALTLACFWRFLFLGWTLYDIRTLEGYLGLKTEASPGWFESHRPTVDRGDTILLLPMLHRLYTDGLHHGELRLWNPDLFCGYPLYNDTQIHPFYPPNLLLHSVLPARAAYDLNLLLHFFFSGTAMYWLLRGLGRSDVAATAGGALWMLLGYNSFWISTGILMGASVFAPLALLGLRHGMDRRDLKPLALGGLAQGLVILGSHAQHALHLLIFFAIWLLASGIRDPKARPFLLKGGALFLGASIGVGMAAILTQLDSILNGVRVPGEDTLTHYASPWRLPTYIANLALGKVCYAPGGLLRSEFTIYAGIAGTVLAGVGAVRGIRDPWIRFLTFFAVSALLVAFVKPLAEVALSIPFLNLSMPARWVYVFGLCATQLAASGLDAMREDPGRSTLAALSASGLCLLALAFHLSHDALAETLVGFGLAAVWIFTARHLPRVSLAFCFLALLVDLLPNFIFFNRHADPTRVSLEGLAVEAAMEPELSPPHATTPSRATGSLRFEGGPAEANPWTVAIGNNLLALHGIEAVMGYEAIAPLTAVRYCIATSGPQSVRGSGRVLSVFNLKSRLLDIANMRYVYMPFLYDPEPRFRKVKTFGPTVVYENTAALPRAYMVSHAVIARDEAEALRLLESAEFDPRTTVVLQAPGLPNTGTGHAECRWKVRESDRIELHVAAESEAILVISDTDYPGWEAEIDGQSAPILRANLAFRAVAVPAGTHTVTMRFRPSTARYGLSLTALSVVALLAYCGRRK